MTTPTIDNPRFIHQNDAIQMFVDDTGKAAAVEKYADHITSDGAKQRVFLSTEVDKDYRGAGLGGKLVQYALDDALEQGYRIVAICPYVKQWIEKQTNPRYEQARDTARPEHFSGG